MFAPSPKAQNLLTFLQAWYFCHTTHIVFQYYTCHFGFALNNIVWYASICWVPSSLNHRKTFFTMYKMIAQTDDSPNAWVPSLYFSTLFFHPHKWSKQMTILARGSDGAHKRESDRHFHNRCFYRGVSSLHWAVSHMRGPQKLQRNVLKTNM